MLEHRVKAATGFHIQEARSMIRLAEQASLRRDNDFQPGDIVYYYSSDKKTAGSGEYKGPDRVLDVER